MSVFFPLVLLTLTLSPQQEIKGQRVRVGQVVAQEGVFIEPPAWLLLRAHLSGSRCEAALDRCAQECANQVSLIECQVTPEQVADLQKVLMLNQQELLRSEDRARRWKWAALSVSAVLTASALAVVYSSR